MGSMVGTKLVPSDQSLGARYESLIRLGDSIRAQHEPEALFRILVNELSSVIPFDAIAQCDESSKKVHWHLGESCQQHGPPPSDIQIEQTLAWWVVEKTNRRQSLPMSSGRHVFPIPWSSSRRLGFNRRARFPSAPRIGGWVVSSSPVKDPTPIQKKRYGF